MKRFIVAAIILITSACGIYKPAPLPTYTYMVTCNFPRETTVDTLVTKGIVWYMKTSYRIEDSYYPTSFCTVRTTINENR